MPPSITLQDILHTLQKRELILLASRPAMGKTTFAVRLIEEMLSMTNLPVVIFSPEYSVQTMAGKLVNSSKVNNFDKLKSGQLNEIIWQSYAKNRKKSQPPQKIFIDDRRGLQPQQLTETCEIVADQYQDEIGMIVICYVQLLNKPAHHRMDDKTVILKKLKALAKQFNCPVLGLFNLHRDLELKWDKHSTLDDFKEKSAIETFVDSVIFLYRDSYYQESSAQCLIETHTQVTIAKNSQKVLGTGDFIYDNKQGNF